MKDIVSRVQRELPDTDQDRYDVAYERGRAQARSGLLFGGLLFGSLMGAGVMWLFDPARGAGRRAQLASRANALKNDLSRTAEGRAKDIENRTRGFAIESGLTDAPNDGSLTAEEIERSTAGAPGTDDRVTAGAGTGS